MVKANIDWKAIMAYLNQAMLESQDDIVSFNDNHPGLLLSIWTSDYPPVLMLQAIAPAMDDRHIEHVTDGTCAACNVSDDRMIPFGEFVGKLCTKYNLKSYTRRDPLAQGRITYELKVKDVMKWVIRPEQIKLEGIDDNQGDNKRQ